MMYVMCRAILSDIFYFCHDAGGTSHLKTLFRYISFRLRKLLFVRHKYFIGSGYFYLRVNRIDELGNRIFLRNNDAVGVTSVG